jgi:ATP-binding protein involved in chromosome partitioning
LSLPLEIIGLGQREVTFVWPTNDGGDQRTTIPARTLRLRCRCAHCVSEMTGERLLDPASVPADIRVTAMELAGNYGVRIEFSDGHATGIYRFGDLRSVL